MCGHVHHGTVKKDLHKQYHGMVGVPGELSNAECVLLIGKLPGHCTREMGIGGENQGIYM